MEFIYSTEISIPLVQIIALLLISTLTLLFGKSKLALPGNYLFGRYWVYIFKWDFSRYDTCLFIDTQLFPQYSLWGANKANLLQVDDKRQWTLYGW